MESFMSKQEHRYAQVLRWIADGETVEVCGPDYTLWAEGVPNLMLNAILQGTNTNRPLEPGHFRLKPRTININGHEVPGPMRVAPEYGSLVWLADQDQDGLVHDFRWDGDKWQSLWLARGLCHSTHEAAEAHARALMSFTTVEV